MRRASFMAALAATFAISVAVPANAGITLSITVDDDFFAPDEASQFVTPPGVDWNWDGTTANTHNVREDSKLFRSGPLTDSGTYHIVPSAGTYHYYCESHGSENGGMDGVLKEIPVAGPRNADFFTVGWAPAEDTDTGDQFDVRYKVEDGEWKTWFKNTDKIGWKFGRNDKPIDVKPNKTYRIQARSELHSNPSKHSGFSPSLVVGPVT